MTCPICNQKINPSDHSEKWGPEFAHSRCVIAFNAGSAIQDAKLQARIKRLEDALTSIGEYWNRDTNERAMEDACWYAVNTAADALEAKEAKL